MVGLEPPFAGTRASSWAPTCASPCSVDADEYNRAVAFMRELRSRRVVDVADATAVHRRLETVAEDDGGLEEMMLAADFALALSVTRSHRSSGDPPMSMKRRRMKKTATVRCLLDLVDSSSSSDDEKSTSSSPTVVQPRRSDVVDTDYCLGCDVINSSPSSSPVPKRQRSHLGRCSSL